MAYIYNSSDEMYWFDTTAQLVADAVVVCGKTAKAAALDTPYTVYISNGTNWIDILTGEAAV